MPFTREPKIRHYHPDLAHSHGTKIRLKDINKATGIIHLASSAAFLTIERIYSDCKFTSTYLISWKIINSQSEQITGKILMDEKHLKLAFGLDDDYEELGSWWLIEIYGGTVAYQGCYIRWKNWLNIPCPGTGHDGDPNITIEIDNGIKNAVKKLILY